MLVMTVTIAGCMVGPEYRRPDAAPPKDFRSQVASTEAGSLADLPWWQVFNDKALQGLITQRLGELLRIAAADADRAAGTGGQLRQRGREHEPPATYDEHPVGRLRDLGEHMT